MAGAIDATSEKEYRARLIGIASAKIGALILGGSHDRR
jgi:hypothetical protein